MGSKQMSGGCVAKTYVDVDLNCHLGKGGAGNLLAAGFWGRTRELELGRTQQEQGRDEDRFITRRKVAEQVFGSYRFAVSSSLFRPP